MTDTRIAEIMKHVEFGSIVSKYDFYFRSTIYHTFHASKTQSISEVLKLHNGHFAIWLAKGPFATMVFTLLISNANRIVTSYRHVHILSNDRILIPGQNDVKIWNPSTNLIEHILPERGHLSIVVPDSRIINGELDTQIWNPRTGGVIELETFTKPVRTRILISDHLVASGSENGEVKVSDINTHTSLLDVKSGRSGIKFIGSFVNKIVTVSYAKRLNIWDIKTGALVQSIKVPTIQTFHVIRGPRIIGLSEDHKLIIWNLDTLNIEKEYPDIYGITILPSINEDKIGAWSFSNIHVISPTNGILFTFNQHLLIIKILWKDFWPTSVISGSSNGQLFIWNYETGEITHRLQALNNLNEIFVFKDGTFVTQSQKNLQFWK